MKKFEVKIKGITPYLQHRMDDQKLEDWEKKRGRIIERDDVAKEDLVRAEFHSYRDETTKKYFIPNEHVRGALINAGAMTKAKVGNSKKSMKNIVAGMFFVYPEKLFLQPQTYVIDKRSAVNQNAKARVITIRPKFENWSVEFELHIDNDTITNETIQHILEDAGNYIGIGSYRPQKNGMYGRFTVEDFKEIK